MSIPKFNPRIAVLLVIMVVVAALRLLSYFTNLGPLTLFTPLGAMALFGGAYFKGNIKPFAFPLLTLFASDIILSFTIYAPYRSGLLYSGWFWTYAAFALMAIAGKLIIKHVTVNSVVFAVLAATLTHWLVSDIGGCVQAGVPSLSTYLQRLGTAIPYELRFLAGTAIYSTLMFGTFELMQKRYPKLAL